MVVQKAINSKKPSFSSIPVKRSAAIGQGIGSLDDFDSVSEVNMRLIPYVVKQCNCDLTGY